MWMVPGEQVIEKFRGERVEKFVVAPLLYSAPQVYDLMRGPLVLKAHNELEKDWIVIKY